MSQTFTLTHSQCDVLAKYFHQSDVEEHGQILLNTALKLCSDILGDEITRNELLRLKSLFQSRIGSTTDPNDTSSMVTFAVFMDVMAEHLATTTKWGIIKTKLQAHIGISTLPEQIKNRITKKGFELNIMFVGESGLGKSTLINTIFKGQLSRQSCLPVLPQIPPTVEIYSVCHMIEEDSVKLKLTITDTPGFGDQVNNSKSWKPILDHINEQFEVYLNEEVSIDRRAHIPDNRVHCCIYFIPPTGHGLRNIDIEFMKRLCKSVNIIPVIGKSDTLTLEERAYFKHKIKEDFITNNIIIYPTSYQGDDDDEDVNINAEIDNYIPFAVIGSEHIYSIGNKHILARKNRWGLIEVENPNHCDFIFLRNMLIRTHMQDMKEKTSSMHYENYRRNRLNVTSQYAESNI